MARIGQNNTILDNPNAQFVGAAFKAYGDHHPAPSVSQSQILSWPAKQMNETKNVILIVITYTVKTYEYRKFVEGRQSNHHRWLASQKISSVEELETLPAGTKPRTSHHRSPEERGVERGSDQRSYLRGRERAIVNQTNIATVSKATLGKTHERPHGLSPSAQIPS